MKCSGLEGHIWFLGCAKCEDGCFTLEAKGLKLEILKPRALEAEGLGG